MHCTTCPAVGCVWGGDVQVPEVARGSSEFQGQCGWRRRCRRDLWGLWGLQAWRSQARWLVLNMAAGGRCGARDRWAPRPGWGDQVPAASPGWGWLGLSTQTSRQHKHSPRSWLGAGRALPGAGSEPGAPWQAPRDILYVSSTAALSRRASARLGNRWRNAEVPSPGCRPACTPNCRPGNVLSEPWRRPVLSGELCLLPAPHLSVELAPVRGSELASQHCLEVHGGVSGRLVE
ncbi:uncharacterized protein LOC128928886 [Callithrix jacchus]